MVPTLQFSTGHFLLRQLDVVRRFCERASNDPLWREVLLTFEACDFKFSGVPWIARVPSSSNMADPPSRGSVESISFLKPFEMVEAKCPISGRALRSLFG